MSERIVAPAMDIATRPLAQEGADLCSSDLLVCTYTSVDPQRYPTVTGGEGTVTIVAQAPISNTACDSIGNAQPGFDVASCKAVLDMTDNASSRAPQSLYIGIHGSVLDIGGGTQPDNFLAEVNSYVGAQEGAAAPAYGQNAAQGTQGVEVTPANPNVGEPVAVTAPQLDLGCWGTIATVALALGAVGAVKMAEFRSRRQSASAARHPHADLRKNTRTGRYAKPYDFPHSKEQMEAISEDQHERSRAVNTVRGHLDEHDVIKRPPDYATWPVSREHSKDTEAVNKLAELTRGMSDRETTSFFFFINRDQQQKYDRTYSDVFWFNRRRGHNGVDNVNMDLDHPFFLQGASGVEQLFQKYQEWRKGNK